MIALWITLGVIGLIIIAIVSYFVTKSVLTKRAQMETAKQAEIDCKAEMTETDEIVGVEESDDVCALRLKNVVKIYGEGDSKVKALRGINLSFRKSEFVSILGPSGCGKTTLLNIIGGLDRYTAGDLLINGVSTKEYKDSDWDTYRNNSVGFVFQNYNLIPHQSILSNVEMALTLSGVSKSERHKRAKEALKQVGLEGLEHKRPNQLSGGQMQRVAIARALVNNPEIILADEPTGALDTETSIQIMELLKEVAKDRLVIMVTHNPEIAKEYSTRIIRLIDGKKTDDSNAFNGVGVEAKEGKQRKGKAQMKIGTALALSMSNLRTKKGRTILTSIAGSIGIIGIALVLALSTGFSTYINKLQSETLSVYPIQITESYVDLEDFSQVTAGTDLDKFPELQKVYEKQMFESMYNMLKSNKITDEYVAFVDEYAAEQNTAAVNSGKDWRYCVQKGYGFDMNDYIWSSMRFKLPAASVPQGASDTVSLTMPINRLIYTLEDTFDGLIQMTGLGLNAGMVRNYIPTLCEIPDNKHLIEAQYDLLTGSWAKEEDELLLVVDQYNRVTDITLALLGLNSIESINTDNFSVEFSEVTGIDFNEIIGKKFYYLNNSVRFEDKGDGFFNDKTYLGSAPTDSHLELKITGVVRLKENIQQGVLQNGLAYTNKLVNRVLSDNVIKYNADNSVDTTSLSPIMAAALSDTKKSVIVQSKAIFLPFNIPNKTFTVSDLAGSDKITDISIYTADYAAKEDLKVFLDSWNEVEGREETDKVHYSDSTAILFSAMNMIVDAVKIVLICFTAISLVVSSIMIGIITYVSVVERTKEIGVLRSIGARKKDISRIFNAETFLIGLFAGLIGVVFTYLISIPINLIIGSFIAGVGSIASLAITDALILITVSFLLTIIAGLFPARIAAKKDPVVALRSE